MLIWYIYIVFEIKNQTVLFRSSQKIHLSFDLLLDRWFNQDHDGRLSEPEFLCAMAMAARRRKGLALPDQMPWVAPRDVFGSGQWFEWFGHCPLKMKHQKRVTVQCFETIWRSWINKLNLLESARTIGQNLFEDDELETLVPPKTCNKNECARMELREAGGEKWTVVWAKARRIR